MNVKKVLSETCLFCGTDWLVLNNLVELEQFLRLGCRRCRLERVGIDPAECLGGCGRCSHFDSCPAKVKVVCPLCGETVYVSNAIAAAMILEKIAVRAPDGGEMEDHRGCRMCRLKRQLPHMGRIERKDKAGNVIAVLPDPHDALFDFFMRMDDAESLSLVVEAALAKEMAEVAKGPFGRSPFRRFMIGSD